MNKALKYVSSTATDGDHKHEKEMQSRPQSKGAVARTLGHLNAAHASATARANAAPHSAVGQSAGYEAEAYERKDAQAARDSPLEDPTATARVKNERAILFLSHREKKPGGPNRSHNHTQRHFLKYKKVPLLYGDTHF